MKVEFRCSERGLLLGKYFWSAVFTLGPRGAVVPGPGSLSGCRALTSSWYPPGDPVHPHNPPAQSQDSSHFTEEETTPDKLNTGHAHGTRNE